MSDKRTLVSTRKVMEQLEDIKTEIAKRQSKQPLDPHQPMPTIPAEVRTLRKRQAELEKRLKTLTKRG